MNGISLHGHWVCPFPRMASENTVFALSEHWQEFGIPTYAQFDNSTVFTRSRHPDSIGQVIRFCSSFGVIPVFPPCETGFQASIERYNGQWQQSVWKRFYFKNFQELVDQSETYVKAPREKNWDSIEATNNRYDISAQKRLHSNKPLQRTIIFIRRTDNKGYVDILGHRWLVDLLWTNRLVRTEVKINKNIIEFYQLRWRAPKEQPLLNKPFP